MIRTESYKRCPTSERVASASFTVDRIVLLPDIASALVFLSDVGKLRTDARCKICYLVNIVDDVPPKLVIDFLGARLVRTVFGGVFLQ